MDSSARSASIARATIGLCTELGLEVTAEGVERLEQFSALLGFGAISLQGYLLAKPICADLLLASLKRIPAHCHELVLTSRALPAPSQVTPDEEPSAIPRAAPAPGQTRFHPPRTP
jgi:predicted signal transduction protein with EAL and GGDEF domain